MRLSASASLGALALSLLFAGTPAAAQNAQAGAAPRPEVTTQLPREVRPLHYRLLIEPDAANMRFNGRADIDIQVLQPTSSITLNAADLEFANVSLGNESALALNPRSTNLDAEKQTATFDFGRTLAPGRYRLTINYRGKINEQANGLFALDYPGAGGAQQRALFTQFEAPDARRMFPSWDEPNFRTPYDLSVVAPRGQMAVSNMPESRREARADGSSVVTFQTTPAMSSYLLFLGLGDFDRITARAGNTEVGVVTRRGAGEQGRWALEAQRQLLPYYNDYFGQPFPLPKLDNVAGPGSSAFFGAMENWGAIFSFESILLDDPAISSEGRRQSIFTVDAHEMAHQWFGDLVTMAWWDDLWLNEGFASWMATKATAALHPEWEPLLGRIDSREAAINLDSLATTHPIVQHVTTVDQISQAFDAITYSKGEAVIAMLEDYVGDTAWRDGVRAYIARHRLGNTVTDDLWGAVETAAGRPITRIAHDFTLQPGVPLIRVESAQCAGGRTQVALSQSEFSRDRQDKPPLAWHVPVIAAAGGRPARILVEGGAARLAVPGCGPLVVNYGQAGYYRTLYSPALLAGLTRNFPALRPIDQIGLLADTWALGLAGYQSASAALDMIDTVPTTGNSRLWIRAADILAEIKAMYDNDPGHQAMLSRYASAKLGPLLRRLGWSTRPGERANDAILRGELIDTLGELGDPEVVAETSRRFAANDPSITAGPLRQILLGIIAYNADAATWERLRAMARDERTPQVKVQLYRLLGSTRDPALARRALELALTDEPGATNASQIFSAVALGHPDLAFDYALAHRERVMGLVDASSSSRFLPGLATRSADPAMVEKLRDYANRYMTPQSRGAADRAIAAIEDRVRVRRERLPDITRWLEARRG